MTDYRIEKDTLGDVKVPADALWGAQTQRAVENYPISGLREHPTFIRAFIYLKKAAALGNKELKGLEPKLADAIVAAFDQKGTQFATIIKSGRTHLQDAVPITLGQEFKAYAAATKRANRLLVDASMELLELGIGGTAAGTGINTPPGYRFVVVRHLNAMTGLEFRAIDDL